MENAYLFASIISTSGAISNIACECLVLINHERKKKKKVAFRDSQFSGSFYPIFSAFLLEIVQSTLITQHQPKKKLPHNFQQVGDKLVRWACFKAIKNQIPKYISSGDRKLCRRKISVKLCSLELIYLKNLYQDQSKVSL